MSTSAAQDQLERSLRALSPHVGEDVIAPEDLSSSVMARLPQGAPGLYRDVAALVLEAWTRDSLREQLRAEPRATLAAHGLDLPRRMQVAIVPPTRVALPTADRIELPVGESSPTVAAPRTTEEARALLLGTEWRWLLQSPADPWQGEREKWPQVVAGDDPRSHQPAINATRAGLDWRRWLPRSRPAAPVWALLGAFGIVLLLVWRDAGAEWGLIEGAGSGTSGTVTAAPPWPWLAMAVLLVVAVYWWSSRRGS